MNGAERIGLQAMMGLREAAEAVGGKLRGAPVRFSGVTTDSRKVHAGDLFVALKGERFDGNEYVGEAAARGAVAAFTTRLWDSALPMPQVVVADTDLETIADLGRMSELLAQRGYSTQDVERIMWRNFVEFFRHAWGVRE